MDKPIETPTNNNPWPVEDAMANLIVFLLHSYFASHGMVGVHFTKEQIHGWVAASLEALQTQRLDHVIADLLADLRTREPDSPEL
jgi:hypothetical protein